MVRTEIGCLQLLHHPNCMGLVDTFESPEAWFIIMELMTGGSMLEYVEEFGKLDELNAYRVVKPLLEAVHYMHELGLLHRDIKSANVLLNAGLSASSRAA